MLPRTLYKVFASALLLACCESGDDPSAGSASSTGDAAVDVGVTAGDAGGGDAGGGDAAVDAGAGDAEADAGGGDVAADAGAGDTTPDAGPPKERAGCDGAMLLELPTDRAARGPWDVGARTVTVGGLLTEIWYPAAPGAADGVEPAVYDVREQLPPAEQDKIPNDEAPLQVCDCARDLPLDTAHGPYPLVVFVHGTAAFRTQSLHQVIHWASRGFVVVASDHPRLKLADVLTGLVGADIPADLAPVLEALAAPTGDLAFLSGHLANDRIGLSGHSAGGAGIATLGTLPGVRVIIPMSARGVDPAPVSTLVMGGLDDQILPFSQQQKGYDASSPPKRIVGLDKAGHLAFSDICTIAAEHGGLLDLAIKWGVTVPSPELFAVLATDGCKEGQLPPAEGWAAINDATSAALEEALQCDATAAAALSTLADRHPAVVHFEEQLAAP